MIVVQLPLKLVRSDGNEESDKSYIERLVTNIVTQWANKYPKITNKIEIQWGSYFDIRGRGFMDSCKERMELYKDIKSVLWSKEHFKRI